MRTKLAVQRPSGGFSSITTPSLLVAPKKQKALPAVFVGGVAKARQQSVDGGPEFRNFRRSAALGRATGKR